MTNFKKKLLLFFGCSIILLFGAFSVISNFSDGPYVIKKGQRFFLQWFESGKLKTKYVKQKNANKFNALSKEFFDAEHLFGNPSIPEKFDFQGVDKIAVLSDVHGQYELFIKILTSNGIIDEKGKWSYGEGHFVLVGDVFDRGDKVTECLWFLYGLEQEAQAAGGKVHYLLGNHEIMVLTGDLRYIHDKYRLVGQQLNSNYSQLFNKETVLGEWLRTKPITMSINDIQFVHGGLSPVLAISQFSVDEINSAFTNKIIDALPIDSISKDKKLKFLKGSQGPIWYRGYFKDPNFTETQLDGVLKFFNKNHIVVGHTSMKKVESHYNGKVIVVDSSIKNGEYGEILFVENGQFSVGDPDGIKRPL